MVAEISIPGRHNKYHDLPINKHDGQTSLKKSLPVMKHCEPRDANLHHLPSIDEDFWMVPLVKTGQ